ncbi:MAG: hypothetical protein HYY16_07580 [Planctomycetes bacterium]|nr:hypothetical protein [Planctomycetota bacterium]
MRIAGPLPAAWGGATAYDLSTRSTGEIRDTLDVMVRAGLRVLRVAILDLETELGRWNDATLERLDALIAEADRRDLRLIIVLHDGPQRADAYARGYPGAAFYADPLARAAFRRRIEHVLTFRGPTTGLVWSELGDVLWAWELQGECHWFHSPEWMEDMAFTLKQLAPGHRVASGAVGRVVGGEMFGDLVKETRSVDIWMYRPTSQEPLDRAAAVLHARCRSWMLVDFGAPRNEPARQRRAIEGALRVAREHRVPWILWSIGRDRRERSHDLWPGDFLFDSLIAPAATEAEHP